jgi:hypothetical protein
MKEPPLADKFTIIAYCLVVTLILAAPLLL